MDINVLVYGRITLLLLYVIVLYSIMIYRTDSVHNSYQIEIKRKDFKWPVDIIDLITVTVINMLAYLIAIVVVGYVNSDLQCNSHQHANWSDRPG